ncbi:hypothetical protein IPdc08_01687 [archaeon]|nr:hypothetical protein IPdc08_01687 [archaeon]
MLVATTEDILGKKVKEVLKIVMGDRVRAKWVGKDILAQLRNLVGRELKEYSDMLRVREQALNIMIAEAIETGAEILAYSLIKNLHNLYNL